MGEVARPWTGKNPGFEGLRRGRGPGVCRALFGPVDHEENQRCLRSELALMTEQDQKKWNFDFVKEEPMVGRYAWTLLSGCPGDDAGASKDPSPGEEASSSLQDSHDQRKDERGVVHSGEQVKQTAPTQRQITDFLRKRKSTLTRKSVSPPLSTAPSEGKLQRRAST